MWVFNVDGFFSVVEDRNNKNGVVIRGRYKEDIIKISKKIHGKVKAWRTPQADYPYRTRCSKGKWAIYIWREARNIDYDNFKGLVDPIIGWARMLKYHEVWSIMRQDDTIFS